MASAAKIWLLVLFLGLTSLPVAAAPPQPETLHFTVDAPLIKDAGAATISLRPSAPDLYEAVIEGGTRGLVGFFSGQRRDRYACTMRLIQGRLQPQLYSEESWEGRKHRYKEYRFDYAQRRLEMWRQGEDGVLVRKWETELNEPIYDPISAFYNFRIGALGEVKGGETFQVAGIPYPQPETITIRVGLQEPGNRQAAVTIRNRPFEQEIGLVHIRFDDDLLPLSAWTRVMAFGKLSGRLVGRQ